MDIPTLLLSSFVIAVTALFFFIWSLRKGVLDPDPAAAKVIFVAGEIGRVEEPALGAASERRLQHSVAAVAPGEADIDELRSRLEAAGRDPASVDIAFATPEGGDPSSDAFDADAHLAGLDRLAAVGVTWVQVGLPCDSVAHALDTLHRYGEQVIR